MDKVQEQAQADQQRTRAPYEPPRVQLMDEEEVLKAFQVTSAGITWWVA
jgi:hypothetical protein